MGKLESIERYGNAYGWPEAYPWVREMAEAVEREVGERFAELPVDADGVPIRHGDELDFAGNDPGMCSGYDWLAPVGKWMVGVRSLDGTGPIRFLSPDRATHRTPTVEDALVRFLADWEGVPASEINAANPKIAAHAERVREAARAE